MSHAPHPEYISHFRTHLLSALPADGPTNASNIDTTSGWSHNEKDTFFRALARYSRLRPDLIAEDLRTRSVAGVCAYLDALAAASAHNGPSALGGKARDFREELPLAHCVSDDWIVHETELAAEVCAAEPMWEASEEHAKSARKGRVVRFDSVSLSDDYASLAKGERTLDELSKDGVLTSYTLTDAHLRVLAQMLRDEDKMGGDQDSDGSDREGSDQAYAEVDIPIDPAPLPRPATPAQASKVVKPSSPSVAMSPASRRRLAKRLYQRRKRGNPDMSSERLKVGRKAKHAPRAIAGSAAASLSSPRDSKGTSRHYGGLTPRQKATAIFADAGVDAASLRECHLDIFRLNGLANVLRLFWTVYSLSSNASDAVEAEANIDSLGSSITGSALLTVRTELELFIREAMRRALALHVVERRLKSHTRVWKVGEEIGVSASSVERALELMGVDEHSLDRQAFFRKLAKKVRTAMQSHMKMRNVRRNCGDNGSTVGTGEDEDVEEKDDEGDSDDGVEDAGVHAEMDALPSAAFCPLHRQIRASLIHLPLSPPFTTVHKPLSATPADSPAVNEAELMSVHASPEEDAACDAELDADAELDKRDEAADAALEKRLWMSMGGAHERNPWDADHQFEVQIAPRKRKREINLNTEMGAKSLRLGPPGGGVKSTVYVEDSDAE